MGDRVIELLSNIEEKQGDLHKSVLAAQSKAEEVEKGFLNSKEAVQKASEDATKAMEEIETSKTRIDAIEKAAEHIEKSISRMGEITGKEDKEMEKRAHDEMCQFLRTGSEMSDEVKEAVVRSIAEKSFHGMTESDTEKEVKSLLEGSNPDGGYFIRPERSARMLTRIFESSPMRRYATIETTNSNSMEFVIDDDEADSGGWVGEIDARGETGTPKIGVITIPVHEQFAQPLATQRMLDDAGFDIEGWLTRKVTNKMTRVENKAFVVGDGAEKPKGFLSYAAWAAAGVYERNKIEQINSGNASALTADGLKKLQNSLIEDYQGNAIFAMKRKTFGDVIVLKDDSGRYLFQSRFINDRDEMRLLGKEITFMNDMPDVAADALAVAYGNFAEGYTICDRIGFRVIRDIYTKKPYVKFYTTRRTGGAVTNFEALKIQKVSA